MSIAASTNAGQIRTREIKLTKKKLRKNPVFPCTTYRPDESGVMLAVSIDMPKVIKKPVY